MCGYADDFENDTPENPKTITITYDPGTKNEEVYTLVTDTSFSIIPFLREGYSLYDDPEGQTPASSSAGKTEITFYAIKGE